MTSGNAAAVTPAASNTAPDSLAGTADIHKPDFPLPSVYGVYAESGGKLYALEPLAMRVPDPRVAISAMISSPSQVLIPSGEIAFVVYRRDLAASAPDSASVRIIARVMRELKFSQAGPPKTIDIKGEWSDWTDGNDSATARKVWADSEARSHCLPEKSAPVPLIVCPRGALICTAATIARKTSSISNRLRSG